MKSSFDHMHSLQVVMTYADDHKYRFRCLPGFLNKKYLYRYVFDGIGRKDWQVNEIYMGHKYVSLDRGQGDGPVEQLYALFHEYGIDQTFDYLSNIAKSSADIFWLHKEFYNMSDITADSLSTHVEESIQEDLRLYVHMHNGWSLDRIISTTTFDLLSTMSVFLCKNY